MNYGKTNSPEYFIERLKKIGMPEDAALLIFLDIMTDENATILLNEYKQDFAVPLIASKSLGPFEINDSSIDGELRFAFSRNRHPVGLNTDEVHTVIAGSSKTGKSICADIINGSAVLKKHKVWIFIKTDDSTRIIRRHRDILYCDFIHDWFRINPVLFLSVGVFVSIFRYSFDLLGGSESYLTDSIAELKKRNENPALLDLFYFIRARKHGNNSRITRHQESVLGRLKELIDSPLNETYNCIKGHEQDIVNTSAIFNISSLTLSLQKFFVCSMLQLLYLHNMEDANAHCHS